MTCFLISSYKLITILNCSVIAIHFHKEQSTNEADRESKQNCFSTAVEDCLKQLDEAHNSLEECIEVNNAICLAFDFFYEKYHVQQNAIGIDINGIK